MLGDEMCQGCQPQGIGAGTNGQVLIACRRRSRAYGIDHHDASLASSKFPESSRKIRRRHHRAVRHQRICSKDEEVVGAVNIGNRNRQGRAVHQRARDLFGHLIDRARGESLSGAEGLDECR